MEEIKKNKIIELSDADFLSFLYSERNREESLNTYQGWNNWALIGVIVTACCTGYAFLKNNSSIDTAKVLYNVSFLLALFLAFNSWSFFFRRERAVDFTKVRMMKEVIPVVKIIFVYIFAIVSAILIYVISKCNFVFWLWVLIILLYSIALVVAIYEREKIVPSFFREMIIPWVWANACYESIVGCVFSIIVAQSFKLAGRQIISPEFELAVCFAAILVLFYFLFELNFSNKVVRRFDAIVDKYLYAGATKEETFHEILKNRMGYGVLDACYKELMEVEKQTKQCVEEAEEMKIIQETVIGGKFSIVQLHEYQDRVDDILDNQQKTLDLSKALLNRMDEIVKESSSFRDIDEFKYVFNMNKQCQLKVDLICESVGEISRLLYKTEKDILKEEITLMKRVMSEGKKQDINDKVNSLSI